MRTGRKHRHAAGHQPSSFAETLETRRLLATIVGTNGEDVPWNTPYEWFPSPITISGAPAGAVATSARVDWKIDADNVTTVEYNLTTPSHYVFQSNQDLYDTGADPFSGYRQTSEAWRTYDIPANTPVNGTWYFAVSETDAWFGAGRIDSWKITITYTTGSSAPEILITGAGSEILDGDITPSTSDGTDFGSTVQGGAALSKTFFVKNTGTADLTLGSVSVPAGYTITQNLPASLAPGDSTNLILSLGTGSAGTFSGDVSFATNDSDENPYNFRISGTVRPPNQAPTDITLSPTSIAENQPSSTIVGTFSSTDPNPGDSFSYSLVSGAMPNDNSAFYITGNQLRSSASFNYESKSSYSIRVRSTDQGGLWFEKAFTISITDVDDTAPTVTSVSINDGAAQRSMVRKLSVTFSEPVTLSTGALDAKLSTGAAVPSTTITVSNPSADQKTYLLTFSGSAAIGGSLPDGVYDLIASASGVHDLAGNVMTANFSQRFHRLFGDSDGNKIINSLDYARLKQTFGRAPADPLFNSAFDYEGNGLINALDLARFRQRYGMSFSY